MVANIILMFVKDDKKVLKIVVISIITLLAVGVGIFVNIYVSSNKWQGYLPIAATLIYTTFLLVAFVKKPGPIQSEALIKMGLFYLLYVGQYMELVMKVTFTQLLYLIF